MNFLSKIIKPKDGEPDLKQAHTGAKLTAHYDQELKRWVFPGEENTGPPPELAPPPMMPSQAGAGPKRFSNSGGRALYTDPFAEMQSRKDTAHQQPAVPNSIFPLLPGPPSSSDAPFPLEGENSPTGSTQSPHPENTSPPDDSRSADRDVTPPRSPGRHIGFEPVEVARSPGRHIGFELVEVARSPAGHLGFEPVEVARSPTGHLGFEPQEAARSPGVVQPEQPTELYDQADQVEAEGVHMTPNTGLHLGLHATELSAIDPVDDASVSYVHQTPLLPQTSLPRKESRDDWFDQKESPNESPVQQESEANESTVEISILGHPVTGGPIVFPSKGRRESHLEPVAELAETLAAIKDGSSGDLVVVRRAISQCVDLAIVRDDPVNRRLFCEALEVVSFAEGPLKEVAKEAVGVLVECLDESSAAGEAEDDRLTASAALGALWNLTFTNERSTDLAAIIEILTSARNAMLTFPSDAEIQGNAAGLLVNIATDRQGQRQLLNLGVIDALVAAVKIHTDNSALLEHTCQLLSMIAARKDLKAQLPPSYVSTVFEIANKSDDPSVRRWAGWLKNLTNQL